MMILKLFSTLFGVVIACRFFTTNANEDLSLRVLTSIIKYANINHHGRHNLTMKKGNMTYLKNTNVIRPIVVEANTDYVLVNDNHPLAENRLENTKRDANEFVNKDANQVFVVAMHGLEMKEKDYTKRDADGFANEDANQVFVVAMHGLEMKEKDYTKRDADESANVDANPDSVVAMHGLEMEEKDYTKRDADESADVDANPDSVVAMHGLEMEAKDYTKRDADGFVNEHANQIFVVAMHGLEMKEKDYSKRDADESADVDANPGSVIAMHGLEMVEKDYTKRDADESADVDSNPGSVIAMHGLEMVEKDYTKRDADESADVDSNPGSVIAMHGLEMVEKDYTKRDADEFADAQRKVKKNQTLFKSELSEADWLSSVKTVTGKYDRVSAKLETYLDEWHNMLPLSKPSTDAWQILFNSVCLSTNDSIHGIGSSEYFLETFWPFRYNFVFMNQKLALKGLKPDANEDNIKTSFFHELEKLQQVRLPYKEKTVIYSFRDADLVSALKRKKILTWKKDLIDDGKHLFSPAEIDTITNTTNKAFALIEDTFPELYESIVQTIGCIAFYKSEIPNYISGVISSSIGLIWFDPSSSIESVPFYAEFIVHEYIHNMLFSAELVHGAFPDYNLLPKSKVKSSIRRKFRPFDKSFHAAYVSTGLVLFHAKAGYLNRATQLSKTLKSSVEDLVEMDNRVGVLDKSGRAMLQAMDDITVMMRLPK